MRLLVDTHVLLWWVTGDRRLSRPLRDLIADGENEVAVSAASFWEIAIKKSLGRIDIDLAGLKAAILADGFSELPIAFTDAIQVESLPEFHRDPFDRILIAQAIAHDLRFVTRDEAVLAYRGTPGFDPLSG